MNFYDDIAEGYNELHGEEQLRKYRIIKEQLQLLGDARVLDVGAGTGIGHEIIPNTGIDPAAKLIAQHPNKESVVGPAEQLPFPDNSFDAAISVTALHHTDFRRALTEMLRVSRGPIAVSLLRKSATTQQTLDYMDQHRELFGELTVIEDDKDTIVIAKRI